MKIGRTRFERCVHSISGLLTPATPPAACHLLTVLGNNTERGNNSMTDAKERELEKVEARAEDVERAATSVALTLREELLALESCLETSRSCLQRAMYRATDAASAIGLLRGQVVKLREQMQAAKGTL